MNNSLIRDRDIVVVGQQPWDTEIGSNCKDIALEFSKHNRVLYVNSPLDRNTLMKNRSDHRIQKRLQVIRGKENGLTAVAPNIWILYPDKIIESINWLPNSYLYTFLNKINNKRFAASILKGIARLGFNNILLFNDNDIFRSFYLKELLKPEISIYYSRDNMLAVDYWKKHGHKFEPELIAKSDICVANSGYLASYCKKYNSNSFYVGQGCNLDIPGKARHFVKPPDLVPFQGPIIGYVGALLSLRLNIKILQYISEQKPEWNIVLIGPEDEAFKSSILHSLPSVHFLGLKDPNQLTSYIHFFDVCLNPQLVNPMTIGNYPRKIDEYLALGKPVVATKTEAMAIFKDYTYLADTKEDYVSLIELALAEDSPERQIKRQEFAATHTWENSVHAIYRAISGFYVTVKEANAETQEVKPVLVQS